MKQFDKSYKNHPAADSIAVNGFYLHQGDIMSSADYIKTVTNFSPEYRNSLIGYFSHLPEILQLSLHQSHHIVIKQMNSSFSTDMAPEFHYSTFLMTLENMKKFENSPSMKARLTDKDQRLIDQYRVARINADPPTRKAVKRDKIFIQYRPLIFDLREQGLSWAKISEYLKRYHKLKVSPAYIQRLFTPPMGDQDSRGQDDYIKSLTKMTHGQRKQLVSVYCNFPEPVRIRIHERKMAISTEEKRHCSKDKISEFHHSCFLIAINDIFFQRLKEKSDYSAKNERIDSISRRKNSLKGRITDDHIKDVHEMRLNRISWRKISDYFLKQYGISISHTSLKKIYDVFRAHA